MAAGSSSPVPPPLIPRPTPAISFGAPPSPSPTTTATDVVGRAALDTYSGLPIQPNAARGAGGPESSIVTVKDVIRYVEAPVFGRSITLRLEIPAGSAVHTDEDVRQGQTRALLTACVSDNADVANSARAELGRLYEFLVLDALERHPDFRRAAEEATHHLTKEQKLGYLLAHTLLLPDGTILLKKPSRPPSPAVPAGVPAADVPAPQVADTAAIGDWGHPGGRPAIIDLPPNHILTLCRNQWKALPTHGLAREALDAPEALLTAWRKYIETTELDRRLAGLGLGGRGDESITGIFKKIFMGGVPPPPEPHGSFVEIGPGGPRPDEPFVEMLPASPLSSPRNGLHSPIVAPDPFDALSDGIGSLSVGSVDSFDFDPPSTPFDELDDDGNSSVGGLSPLSDSAPKSPRRNRLGSDDDT